MRKLRLRKIRRHNVIYTEKKRTGNCNPGLSNPEAYKTVIKMKEEDMLKMCKILT